MYSLFMTATLTYTILLAIIFIVREALNFFDQKFKTYP
jgi:hypothetical protein